MRSFRRTPTLLPHTLVALALLACGGDGPTTPSTRAPTMSASLGDGATETVAQPTTQSPTVVITDGRGQHPSGVTVTFTPDTASGTVAQATATTDANGIASAGAWTLGTRAGAQHVTASATVDGTALTTTFTATATAGRPAALSIVSGGAQDGPYGASLVTPMVVRVADKYGNPSSGVMVRFSIDSGGVIIPGGLTAADGTASTRIRLPRATGQAILTAAVDSGPSVQSTFTSRGIRVAKFALYANSGCVISVEGYPYCWGDNSIGQLVPLGISAGHDAFAPQPVTGDYAFTSITLNDNTIGGCGIEPSGTAVCWGTNLYGEAGTGTETPNTFEGMRPITSNLTFVEIARGTGITCGTAKDGGSYCWGGNSYMPVGAASYYQSTSLKPVLLDGGHTFHSFSGGWHHMCAIDATGAAYCWGMNLDGRLGVAAASTSCDFTMYNNGIPTTTTTTCAPSPVAVNTSVHFTSLSASYDATCAVSTSSDVYCWGANTYGELATGDSVASAVPAKVNGLPPMKEVHGGGWGFCGLSTAGDIYCWGIGASNLGIPTLACGTSGVCMTPVKLNVTRQFSTIEFTLSDMCGLSGGVAYCWGANFHGALGIGVDPAVLDGTSTPTALAGQTP